MAMRRLFLVWVLLGLVCALGGAARCLAVGAPLGGFIPYVGIGLTNEFKTFDGDPTGTFFISDPSFAWGGTPLANYFDIALLDTGAATHILTQAAASASGFNLQAQGYRGNNFQTIFGASGTIDLRINNPLGVYAAGLGDRTGGGPALTMDTSSLRGQTSFAMLEAPASWTLPNILGLPIAAHHAIAIRNDQPQIFQHQGRTVRTPQVDFIDLGSGGDEGILRRTDLRIRPSLGFIQGPLYVFNLDIFGGTPPHQNPESPSIIESGAMFIEVDMFRNARSIQDKEFLFDTGADLTVVSELTAARLGFDVLLDTPDFLLEVEGAGGVTTGIPGFYLDELNIDTVGGSFTVQNVPVAVLDLPDPNDPANVLNGILGMHVFTGRNLVIDAIPAANPGGGGPRLYISDPVAETYHWTTTAASGDWAVAGNWSAADSPDVMWVVDVANVAGTDQAAIVSADSTVYHLTVSGTPTAQMTVRIDSGAALTTYGETLLKAGGRIELDGGTLNTQFVNIEGGTLAGSGLVFAGTGPIHSPVRNLGGRIEPDGLLTIDGDLSQLAGGTLAIDLAGTTPISEYDRLTVTRSAFLAGTLEVSLQEFAPNVGDAFTILTAGHSVVGQFDTLALPGGFVWDVAYGAEEVVLSVVGLGLAGDFNGDGTVDAADYALWRKNGGSQQDYLDWRSNFSTSTTAGTAGNSAAGVPEPAGASLILLAACGLALRKRGRSPAPF